MNRFSHNKSLYFYSRSFKYLLNNSRLDNYTSVDAKSFQNSDTTKHYLNAEYPLLHKLDTLNPLGDYFKAFESKPNIVILIVEGLNDDFIHKYKGVELMPFLSNLKNNSLYWSRCFTLGERSYAAVPSIIGSLPYGKIGFTLLDRLPRHISLVSILNSNGYFTSFFYGQGSWFHKKDKFLRYNDIGLIFDYSRFSDKYKKIIVEKDNFFWGYNDKDLFNQSFEVIDTLTQKPRLDIYFTGTSHSPFAITDEEYYDRKLNNLLNEIIEKSKIDFFNNYSKYIKSILFVDDALKKFFAK